MEDKYVMRKLVANELKILRIENNETIESLGDKSGVAPSTICKYEQESKNMNLEKIRQIIEPYGMSLPVFFARIIAKSQKINHIPIRKE